MRFIINSGTLLKKTNMIAGIIGSNMVLAALDCIKFEVGNNTLTMTATDLESSMQVSATVTECHGEGVFCVEAKALTDYLKLLPEQPLSIKVEDNALHITSTTGNARMTCVDSKDFPRQQTPQNTGDALDTVPIEFTLLSYELLAAINATLFACSSDTLRPAMTGIYFGIEPGKISFVATDAHRLVEYIFTGETPGVPTTGTDGFVVPKKTMQHLKAQLHGDSTVLNISYNHSHLFIRSPELSVSCRLIDARFPDYKAVITRDNPYVLTINRLDLISTINRVGVFANKTTNQVVLTVTEKSIDVSGQDIDFGYEGLEKITCYFSGTELKIAFNGKLMQEVLANLPGENVEVYFSNATRAGIFKPVRDAEAEPDGKEILMLLMPLMVGV